MQLIKNGWSGIIIEARSEECMNLRACINYFFPNNDVNILNCSFKLSFQDSFK
jgi:hypothetical protein